MWRPSALSKCIIFVITIAVVNKLAIYDIHGGLSLVLKTLHTVLLISATLP